MAETLQLSDALNAIVEESEQDEDKDKELQLVSGAKVSVEVIGRKRYFDLRDKWSTWIIRWITALIVFNMAITLLVGSKALDFSEYEWFISAVLVQTFLQILGLGAVAVKYLFTDT